MTKLTLTDINNVLTSQDDINANSRATETAVENTLSRDGSAPNEMHTDLDMNSYRVLNSPDGLHAQDLVTVGQLEALTAESVTDALDSATLIDIIDTDELLGDSLQHVHGATSESNIQTPVVVSDSKTLTVDDYNRNLDCYNATEILLTLDSEDDVPNSPGVEIIINQLGAGNVRVAGGTGVTVNTPDTLVLDTQYSSASLRYTGDDKWQFVRYWTSGIVAPEPEPGQPDLNSPKGHVICVDVLTNGTGGTYAKREQDLELALAIDADWAAAEKMKGIARKATWADLDTSNTFEQPDYQFDNIESWCQTAADSGKVLWVGVIWRSFSSLEAMPPWLADEPYRSISTDGKDTTCARMERVDVAGYYMDLITAISEHMTGKPGFAGVLTSETAMQHGSELTLTTGRQFRDNLKDIWLHICTEMPDYNHFCLANFLNYPNTDDGGGVSSGEIYDCYTETYDALALLGQSNMIVCSPDIIPYQKGLSITGSGDSYKTDRLYATWREINKTHPDMKMSSWIQYNSFKINPNNVSNKTEGVWGIPDTTHAGDVANLWPMEEVFLWYLEQNFHSEWVLWNWLDYGNQSLTKANQGGQVIRDYATWERPVNLIDCNVAKDFSGADWSSTGIDSIVEDNANEDAQYQKRLGSHSWVEDTGTTTHKYSYTIPAANFQVGEVYTASWYVHQIPATNTRRFRLEATAASGVGADTASATFNIDTLSFDQQWNNAAEPRYQEAWAVKDYNSSNQSSTDTGHLEYYLVQMDFVPVADSIDTNDITINFKLQNTTNDTSWQGSGSANVKVGECSVFYKNRK